ncbi:MAG TPA: hypothetical protein VFX92_03435, partial [Candidatus Krumholzibacteria bacterium]|nr:hypothetical protein [Candidatus Krumholzibacteria bacterium]
LVIVGGLVAAISLFDALWIAHNLRIARNGRRRTRPDAGPVPAFDFLGRLFVAQNDEQLRRARYIEVHVIEMEDDDSARGHKLFKITDEVPRS